VAALRGRINSDGEQAVADRGAAAQSTHGGRAAAGAGQLTSRSLTARMTAELLSVARPSRSIGGVIIK
jgi:hypothetical protein